MIRLTQVTILFYFYPMNFRSMNMHFSFFLALFFSLNISALTFDLPVDGDRVVGENYLYWTEAGEDLFDVAHTRDLGYEEVTAANREVDPLVPGEDTRLSIPSRFILPDLPRKGVIINLAEPRLYFYPKGKNKVITYPLGIGRDGWKTPLGKTKITRKKEGPTWRPPASILKEHEEMGDPLPRVVPPGPDNPLGTHALYLDMPGYLIHGTNKDKGWGVGRRVSHGCIRLYPKDILALYPELPVNTQVQIILQPYKAAWRKGQLYLEVQPPLIDLEEDPEFIGKRMVESQRDDEINLTAVVRVIMKAIGKENPRLDWGKIQQMVQDQTGIAEVITMASTSLASNPITPQ